MGYEEGDEPRDDDDADDDAPDRKLADGEDPVIEEEDGEFQGSASNEEDATYSEE